MTDRMDDSPAAQIAPTSRSFPRLGASIRRLGPFGAGVLAALAAIVVYGVLFPGQPPLSQRQVNDSIAQALASQTPAPALSQQAYVVIQPSLVLIQTEPAAGATAATAGLGSGVIIDDRGDILTSLHVVADAATIELTFADGTRSTATISVRRPDQDTAVLLADHPPAGLAPATLGSPGAVRVGSDAFVVGNPFGLYASMSAGVVSGLHRTFQMPDGGPILRELIQVDAAVNPGNSGGPLLDRDGRVIGIVAALINPTNEDVFVGIGLAVPIDAAGGAAGLPQY